MQKKFPILLQESRFDKLFDVASEHDFDFSKKCEKPTFVPFMTKDLVNDNHNWVWQQLRIEHNCRVKKAREWAAGPAFAHVKPRSLSGNTIAVSKLHFRPSPKGDFTFKGVKFMDIAVPCQKCPTCLARRKTHWNIRIEREIEQAHTVVWGTLTYEDKHYDALIDRATNSFEPWGPKTPLANTPEGQEYKNQLILGESPEWLIHLDRVANPDLQHYFERCKHKRKKTNTKGVYQQTLTAQDLRYVAVSELGSESRRFHWHVLVFYPNPKKRNRVIDLKYNWSHQRQYGKDRAAEEGVVYETRGQDFIGLGFADMKIFKGKSKKRDRANAAKYITKYITKDNIGVMHKSRYIGLRVWDEELEKWFGPKDAPTNDNVEQFSPTLIADCDNIVEPTVKVEQFQDQPRQSPKRALNCWDAKKAGLEMPNQAVYDQYPQDLRICLERGSIEGHYIKFVTNGEPLDTGYPKFLKMRLAVYERLGQRSLRPEDVYDSDLILSLFRLPESDYQLLVDFLRIRFGQLGVESSINLPSKEEVDSDIPF